MLLDLDLALRAQPHPREVRVHYFTESRFGEEEEIVVAPPQDDERSDQARLRREQQRRARLSDRERFDVVRDHSLQVVSCDGSHDADELPLSRGYIHAV
jgi:hypothetical protein